MKQKKRNLVIAGITVCIGLAGLMTFSSFDESDSDENSAQHIGMTEAPITTHFDIVSNEYTVVEGNIARNEFLSTLLDRHGVDAVTVQLLADKSRDIFDVRRISAGNPYSLLKNADGKVDYFIYQPNKIDYIVYDLKNGIEVRKGQKDVVHTVKSVTGVINSSLYQTLDELNVSPDMATKLADIYGWSVNFYKINKGDWFKIQYELQEVDGVPVSSGKILSAVFGHQGKEYQAYFFETEDGNYFDENGNSLKRAFLKAPLKYSRISSRFSPRRLHPVQKVWKAHLGTDFAAPTGTPILATGDGMVVASTYAGGNGNYVKIQHDQVYATQYLHMSKRAVKRGDRVKQGDVIGYVGSTGLATGPHVCYRFWENGKQVDPLKKDFGSSEPLAEKYKVAFQQSIADKRGLLAALNPFEDTKPVTHVDQYTFHIDKFLANLATPTTESDGQTQSNSMEHILIKRF